MSQESEVKFGDDSKDTVAIDFYFGAPDKAAINKHLKGIDVARLYRKAVVSRNLLRRAIKDGNMGEVGVAFGWLDATLTEAAAMMFDSHIRKDFAGDLEQLSGGGEKPTI